MRKRDSLSLLTLDVVTCEKCPRLVEWRERVASAKRRAYQDDIYWGKPVPGFGKRDARLLVCGLAPAAHGGNRTGRVFTGDRSGDWLFGALYRAGFANQPTSVSLQDGLQLRDCYIAACVRCAPPDNKPTPEERDNCQPYLLRELAILNRLRIIVCLGKFAWDGMLLALRKYGHIPSTKIPFGHGAEMTVGPYHVLGSYHPSQQNTFTGRLTVAMLDSIFARVRGLIPEESLRMKHDG